MYFELLSSQSSASKNHDQIRTPAYWVGFMEGGRTRRNHSGSVLNADYMRTLQHDLDTRSYPSAYFSLESFLLLLLFAASLLILPLILPPLPPPPSLLLLLPIGLLGVLLILAFMPSDIRKITTSYL